MHYILPQTIKKNVTHSFLQIVQVAQLSTVSNPADAPRWLSLKSSLLVTYTLEELMRETSLLPDHAYKNSDTHCIRYSYRSLRFQYTVKTPISFIPTATYFI